MRGAIITVGDGRGADGRGVERGKGVAAMGRGVLAGAVMVSLGLAGGAAGEAPLFRDFVGLCGHTVAFKPDLYQPVCRWVRDYHPAGWDLQGDTSRLPEWPFARNRVSWEQVYGSWRKRGLHISACLMIDELGPQWKDLARDAHAYGRSFAEHFGPGGRWPHVEVVEIGNEPGLYDDDTFRTLFEAMARGIRAGNPRVRIATCNVEVGKSDRYWKGTDLLERIDPSLYDIVRIHRYAIAEGWPVWRRSFPEDPAVPFLSRVQEMLDWRDRHAAGKPVWVGEFGWDACTRPADPKHEGGKFQDASDEQQARWLVRAFLHFARMGVDKAFVYFFNDDDKPTLHAASGLTRNYQPKPAYHAVAWMLAAIGDHRFARVVQQTGDGVHEFEFAPGDAGGPLVRALWVAAGEPRRVRSVCPGRVAVRAERQPTAAGPAPAVKWDGAGESVTLEIGEEPVLIWWEPAAK